MYVWTVAPKSIKSCSEKKKKWVNHCSENWNDHRKREVSECAMKSPLEIYTRTENLPLNSVLDKCNFLYPRLVPVPVLSNLTLQVLTPATSGATDVLQVHWPLYCIISTFWKLYCKNLYSLHHPICLTPYKCHQRRHMGHNTLSNIQYIVSYIWW